MTWCAKIYDIFNGWNEEDHESPASLTNSHPIATLNNIDYYRHETDGINQTVIQHDSPFLEKSDSLTNSYLTPKQSYNGDYLNMYEKYLP